MLVTHTFEPVFDDKSRVLILGTFPSVKSREGQFYYHHPQNRFWKVMAMVAAEETPVSIESKRAMLLRHGIAIWDVIRQCEITGSSDSSIRQVVPADLSVILEQADIVQIFGNGQKACELYERWCRPVTGRPIVKLPSTSPANAAYSLDRLYEEWKAIAEALGNTGENH